ncbi:hypothetical protein P7C70_g2673, partial [Phenoliferia sp. Uapishka_3]
MSSQPSPPYERVERGFRADASSQALCVLTEAVYLNTPPHPLTIPNTSDHRPPPVYKERPSEAASTQLRATATARWEHRKAPFFLSITAAASQTALLVASIYITIFPVILPSSDCLGPITVKNFNASSFPQNEITFADALRDGITLQAYESVRMIGEARIPWRANTYAIGPIFVFILIHLASPAIVSIWTASPAQADLSFTLNDTSVTANPQYYSNFSLLNPQLYHIEEYDGLVVSLTALLASSKFLATQNISTAPMSLSSSVDDLSSPIGSGVSPLLRQVRQLETSVNFKGYIGVDRTMDINRTLEMQIRSTTSNVYTFQAPVTVAESTNVTSDSLVAQHLRLRLDSYIITVLLSVPFCPGTIWQLEYVNAPLLVSTVNCMSGSASYTGYFAILGTRDGTTKIGRIPTFIPLASYLTTVVAGVGSNIKYFSQNMTYELGTGSSPTGTESNNSSYRYQLDVGSEANATNLADHLVTRYFGQDTLGGLSSSTLVQLLRVLNAIQASDDVVRDAFATLTRAMYAMAVTKQVSQETTQYIARLGHFPADVTQAKTSFIQVSSLALRIGPSGWSVLYNGVVAAMWVAVVFALRISSVHRPVTLDPLDPISVLLVAHNSPPAAELNGGGTGDLDQLATHKVNMRLRALDPDHLGFVYGEREGAIANYPGPVVGQRYG